MGPLDPGVQSEEENSGISDHLCRADKLGHHLTYLTEKKELHSLPQALFKYSLLPRAKSENIIHLIKYLSNTVIGL